MEKITIILQTDLNIYQVINNVKRVFVKCNLIKYNIQFYESYFSNNFGQ